MSSPFVALTVTVSASASGVPGAGRVGEVGVHHVEVGAADVVDDEVVGAAERVEVDALDVVEVHHDVAEVAEEPHPSAVRARRRRSRRRCAAVEQHRVGAVLALDHVAAVAGIPLERVVAGAHERDVVALLAVDEVVAVATEQEVDAVAAEQGVVAGAAVDGDRHAARPGRRWRRTSRRRRWR